MEFAALTQTDIDSAADWMREIPLRADRWRDNDTRSVIATESGATIAAGIMWTTRVHGDRYWCEIAVAPGHRRRGVGRAVFDHLRTRRARDLGFMARGYVGDDHVAFARALGAHTIQVVPPSAVAVAHRTLLSPHPSVASAAERSWGELAAHNAEVYAWTHAAWSPVGPGFADALNADLIDELDVEASSVAIVRDRIVANCLVYRDSSRPVVTAETAAASTPDGERLVEGCVRRSLDVLAGRGITEAEFDGHVSDPHFLPVWTRLSPTGRWFHLLEIPAQRAAPFRT
ncbi:MAG: GNAT family N-acetyltransferase [Microbacterium sp.]|uniref:GNAT family N-acetyltransferase n=1 Tax=Microbacterium sp. TaxID=51671 RepID=UPI001ACA78F0|nr:GNAT family N-acetyltransferase [Microbacterium sp.]MBN9178012.1 GNAT family N-acetyltransferase [Microbacterium sp.]